MKIGKIVLITLFALVLLTAGACGGGGATPTPTPTATPTSTPMAGDDSPGLTSHFTEVEGLTWHYVEGGDGQPIVFIHGLPESWYSWHYQLEYMAADYRVIAIDLKGYGQSDKADGDYSIPNVAEEVVALLDYIGLGQFNLVTHDWGTVVGDYIAASHPHRIVRYVRMQAPLLRIDPANHPQFAIFRNQELATQIMSNTNEFVRSVYDSRTVQPILEEDMARIIEEFSREGVAESVPRYFRDFSDIGEEMSEERAALFAAMDLPVLLLQADSDPAQPQWYFEGATDLFPNAELQWVENSGHFSELEQPEAVNWAIHDFLKQ